MTKNFDHKSIVPLLEIGHKHFGENRVQEAEEKWPILIDQYQNLVIHMIGHLQRNKVKIALETFDIIHAVDSIRLVNEIKKNLNHEIKCKQYFTQVNLAEELQKDGISLDELKGLLTEFNQDNKIECKGLMCIPPVNEEPSPYFALLSKTAKNYKMESLSLGMSSDFEKAIQFGATHIRVGSKIFGSRV